jgi:hypothetical protein
MFILKAGSGIPLSAGTYKPFRQPALGGQLFPPYKMQNSLEAGGAYAESGDQGMLAQKKEEPHRFPRARAPAFQTGPFRLAQPLWYAAQSDNLLANPRSPSLSYKTKPKNNNVQN